MQSFVMSFEHSVMRRVGRREVSSDLLDVVSPCLPFALVGDEVLSDIGKFLVQEFDGTVVLSERLAVRPHVAFQSHEADGKVMKLSRKVFWSFCI